MKIVEILYPELCNLFGDVGNIKYLQQCLELEHRNDIAFMQTSFTQDPLFLTRDVNLIYMGAMTERTQEKIVAKWSKEPYRSRLAELIENGTVFLFTGNAFEIMGSYIKDEDTTKKAASKPPASPAPYQVPESLTSEKVEALGDDMRVPKQEPDTSKFGCLELLPFYVTRNMLKRWSGLVLAEFSAKSDDFDDESENKGVFENIDIVGFRAQFTKCHLFGNEKVGLFGVSVGDGMKDTAKGEAKIEGVRVKNFFGTYLLGPLLVSNPQFTEYLLTLAGFDDIELPFAEELYEAYERRLIEFSQPKIRVH
jgi:CobQ-like glutamine amidotransferase family enzyme